jgi:hypothetical protein
MKPELKADNSQRPTGVAVQRVVSLRADKGSCVGAWEITCEQCPLLPHLKALDMKAKPCVAGIQTNVQGAVPLSQCEHYEKDSIKSEGKKVLTLKCTKAG